VGRAKSKCKTKFSARQAAACGGWRQGGSVRLKKGSRKGYNFSANFHFFENYRCFLVKIRTSFDENPDFAI
jgi:hypothetical protein